jgi:hypothetical protein
VAVFADGPPPAFDKQERRTMTATEKTAGPKTSAFCRALLPVSNGCPPHLLTVALHEAGHMLMALLHEVCPCLAKVWIDDAGAANGDVCSQCHPSYARLTARQRALISAAGAAAGRMHLDAGDVPTLLSKKDATNIAKAGLKPDDPKLMREACQMLKRHRRALIHFATLLARHRTLNGSAIVEAVKTSRHLQSVREVLSAKV